MFGRAPAALSVVTTVSFAIAVAHTTPPTVAVPAVEVSNAVDGTQQHDATSSPLSATVAWTGSEQHISLAEAGGWWQSGTMYDDWMERGEWNTTRRVLQRRFIFVECMIGNVQRTVGTAHTLSLACVLHTSHSLKTRRTARHHAMRIFALNKFARTYTYAPTPTHVFMHSHTLQRLLDC
jgi:hypothetical protein